MYYPSAYNTRCILAQPILLGVLKTCPSQLMHPFPLRRSTPLRGAANYILFLAPLLYYRSWQRRQRGADPALIVREYSTLLLELVA